jgi:hypothetical protein
MTDIRSDALSSNRLKQVALAAACSLVVLAAVQGSARAEDDEENSIWNLDTRIYKGFMQSLGLKTNNDQTIDYRERSPLVVPPSRDLPPPEATGTVPAPAWPVDPDQKRRKEAAAAKRNKRDASYALDRDGVPLSPSELDPPGAKPRSSSGGGSNATAGGDPDGSPVLPSKLGYFGGLFSGKAFGFGIGPQKDEVGTFTREPPREALTAPPPGYQTPSPAAPYGVTKRNENKVVPLDPAVGNLGN